MNILQKLKPLIIPGSCLTVLYATDLIPNFKYTNELGVYEYTTDEVSTHNTEGDIWVTNGNKVYDITTFVDSHPGGKDTVLMAAGDSVDYYWNIYKQHNSEYVQNLLKQYEIGILTDYQEVDLENEYKCEPERDTKNHIVHKKEPYNAELKTELLLDNHITPEKNWFTRNHHPVPIISPSNYQLDINGKSYNYDDLIKLEQSEVTTTIQCAGNRRSELEKTMGLPWGGGAIATGKWTGVWLDQIIKTGDKKFINISDYNRNFSISVPSDAKIMLALKLNGEVLTNDRGYPVRVIVPGYTGSKNVKWVEKIEFSDTEVDSPWQTGIAYKKLPHTITKATDITPQDIRDTPTIGVLPIQSYITNKKIVGDKVELSGYAISGGKRVTMVEVSGDGGKTWLKCEITNDSQSSNSWVFWGIVLPNTDLGYICRATDEDDEMQQVKTEYDWNIRGIGNNFIHKVF